MYEAHDTAGWAERHCITLTAEKVSSIDEPAEPSGRLETWRWAATTALGHLERVDETDGTGSHDAFTRLFGWWADVPPDPATFAAAVGALGPDATAELVALVRG